MQGNCNCTEACEESSGYICAWCGPSDDAPDPPCLKYRRDGKCIEFADGFTPDPSACNTGTPATIRITFPPASSLPSSGDGAWFSPPGGFGYWFDVDGGNDPPATHDDISIAVLAGDDATAVRDAAAAALTGEYEVGIISFNTLLLTRLASGAVAGASQSGQFTFGVEGDGSDSVMGDFCQIPRVLKTPYDYESGFEAPPVDANHDDVNDFDALMQGCLDSFNIDILGCSDGGGEDACICIANVGKARHTCERAAFITMTPAWLDVINVELNRRRKCCGGQYSKEVGACEQTYLSAVASTEVADITALKAKELLYWDGIIEICGLPAGEDYWTRRFYDLPDSARIASLQANFPTRFAHVGIYEKARAKCIADAQRDDMVRRKICPAYQHGCELNAKADYDYAQANCIGSYLCDDPDTYAACMAGYRACITPAITTYATTLKECCKAEHVWAANHHELADCREELLLVYYTSLLACCTSYESCLKSCTGDPASATTCAQACVDERNTCEAAIHLTLDSCSSLKGDCPDCFNHTLSLDEPPVIHCNFEHPSTPCCAPLEIDGKCFGSEHLGCPDPDEGCGLSGDCCPSECEDDTILIISCDWFHPCYYSAEGHTLAGDIPECPRPYPPPPPPPRCTINID